MTKIYHKGAVMKKIILSCLSIILSTFLAYVGECEISPVRSKGISAHFVPSRVANQGDNVPQGFWVHIGRERFVFATPNELLEFFKKQDKATQENGIWLVITNPLAYSIKEKNVIDRLEKLCKQKNVILFKARGMDLPNGWERIN